MRQNKTSRFLGGLAAIVLALAPSVFAGNHVVSKGENLTGICRNYNASIADVVKANEIENPDLIKVGQRLEIPEDNVQAKPKKSYKTEDFSEDDDKTLIARVVFGEARDRKVPYLEKVAVAHSVLTRKDDKIPYNGEGTIRNVAQYPYGYSCFSKAKFNADNLEAIKNPEAYDRESWKTALEIADGVYERRLPNPVPGANLYDLRGCNPKWLKSSNVKRLSVPNNFKHIWCRESKG